MLYSFTAKKESGELIHDKREAPDKVTLSRELRSEGLSLILASEEGDKTKAFFEKANTFFIRINLHERIIFTRNLSAMLHSGISLSRALGILFRQSENIKMKKLLDSLSSDINKGVTLSEGMKKFPDAFPPLFVSMVKAGEESGSLPESLNSIGLQLEKHYALVKKVRGAMIYPAIVLSAMLLIGALMLIYVVPTLTATFADLDVPLPKTTQFIIFLSDILIAHTFSTILFVVGFVLLTIWVSRTKKGKRFFHFLYLKIPIIGPIVKEVNSARATRTLSSLLVAGVDVRRALSITGDVIQNVYYKDTLKIAEDSVEKGLTLSSAFKEKKDLYPVMVGEMMEVGEETGKLSEMLSNIALFYEDEVESKTKNISTIIEPILMLVIGGGVGFFAVSMIAPTYSILNSI